MDPMAAMSGIQSKLPFIEAWRSQLTAGLGVLEMICGLITAISIFPTCIITGVLQMLVALVVLAVEAPLFVSFLSFAAPIGAFFEGKPDWFKAAVYGAICFLPFLPGCFGLFYIIGFLSGLGVAAIYAMVFIGRRGGAQAQGFQPQDGGEGGMSGGMSNGDMGYAQQGDMGQVAY